MKKTLLISAAVLIAASGFAQSNRTKYAKPILNSQRNKIVDVGMTPIGNPNQKVAKVIRNANASSACTTPFVTKAGNLLSVSGGPANNCFTYNKDLNAVSWVTRNGGWNFPGYSNGAYKALWADVTTGVWDSIVIYKDSTSTTSGGRYPGGAVLNPKGNTNIANTYFVAAGPHVTTAFDGLVYAARPATGAYHNPPNNKINTAVIPGAGQTTWGNLSNGTSSALDVDMQTVGTTKVMVTGPLRGNFYTNTTGGVVVKGIILGTAKTPYVNGNLTWTHDSIIPGFHTSATAAGTGYAFNGDGRMAFGPDSLTGYIVFEGRLATDYNNSQDSMMSPIVYKTTNGGTTWALQPVSQGYDWRCKHPELMKNVAQGAITTYTGSVIYRDSGYVAQRFSLNGAHGADITVDANGILHYVTGVSDPYQNGRSVDSLIYGYTYDYDYINYHPIMWDLMTDGTVSYGWKTMMVDSIITAHMGSASTDSTSLNNQWYYSPTSSYMAYGAELNVSRSVDGTKIFYGWSDSDPNITSTVYNTQPDLFMKGYDVTTNKLTSTINVTNGLVLAYFPRLSDLSYFDNTSSSYVVPAMVTNGTVHLVSPTAAWDAISPVDFHYVNCGSFNAASFSIPAPAPGPDCTVGIKTNNAFLNAVSNYPNPFTNSTNIVVNLNTGKTIDVKVYDAIGKVVFTKTVTGNIGQNTIVVDAANLNSGVYYYTVTAGYDRVTKKMVIQK
jgi:hypothetical protein